MKKLSASFEIEKIDMAPVAFRRGRSGNEARQERGFHRLLATSR
jgi:hypothetical protein